MFAVGKGVERARSGGQGALTLQLPIEMPLGNACAGFEIGAEYRSLQKYRSFKGSIPSIKGSGRAVEGSRQLRRQALAHDSRRALARRRAVSLHACPTYL